MCSNRIHKKLTQYTLKHYLPKIHSGPSFIATSVQNNSISWSLIIQTMVAAGQTVQSIYMSSYDMNRYE